MPPSPSGRARGSRPRARPPSTPPAPGRRRRRGRTTRRRPGRSAAPARPSSAIANGSRYRMSQRHADEFQRPAWSWHAAPPPGRSPSAAAPQTRRAGSRLVHRHRARAAPGARPPLELVPFGRVRASASPTCRRRTWPRTCRRTTRRRGRSSPGSRTRRLRLRHRQRVGPHEGRRAGARAVQVTVAVDAGRCSPRSSRRSVTRPRASRSA